MGNNYTSVLPGVEPEEPLVMLTYDPRPQYDNFEYSDEYSVYSNKVELLSHKSAKPLPWKCSAEPKLANEVIRKAIKDVEIDDNLKIRDLVNKLFEKCENVQGGCKEISAADKVKILFYWLTSQNVKYSEYFLTVDFETVNYQLQKLHDRKNSYAAFFAMLCCYAEIPCVIIRGFVKGGRYEIGRSLEDNLLREWNAVLVDDDWQFVDTFWGRVYHGRRVVTDEWFLFPQPFELIFSHLPENPVWQLLETPITKEIFMTQPLLKTRFFQMEMELNSDQTCDIKCEEGQLELNFLLNEEDQANNQEFRCIVSKRVKRGDDFEWESVKLPDENLQIDFIHKKSNDADVARSEGEDMPAPLEREMTTIGCAYKELSVQIRFPQSGHHKVEIVGRQNELEEYDWVAIYHVYVKNVPDWQVFFPKMTNIGWGSNPYLKQCGLKAISHPAGEIKCFVENDLNVIFQILPQAKTRNVKLTYTLKQLDAGNTNHEDEDLEDKMFEPNGNTIVIPIDLNDIGEYQLSIAATLNATFKGDIIHYRVVAEVDQSAIRNKLANEVLKELEHAIKTEMYEDLKNAIHSATSKNIERHPDVRSSFRKANSLFKKIKDYRLALQKIGQINSKVISNLKALQHPNPGVVKVMQAVFVILGEADTRCKNWSTMTPMLTGIGPDALHRRIQNVDMDTIPDALVRKAKEKLGDMDLIGALKQTEEAAVIAKWLEMIFRKYNLHNRPGTSISIV